MSRKNNKKASASSSSSSSLSNRKAVGSTINTFRIYNLKSSEVEQNRIIAITNGDRSEILSKHFNPPAEPVSKPIKDYFDLFGSTRKLNKKLKVKGQQTLPQAVVDVIAEYAKTPDVEREVAEECILPGLGIIQKSLPIDISKEEGGHIKRIIRVGILRDNNDVYEEARNFMNTVCERDDCLDIFRLGNDYDMSWTTHQDIEFQITMLSYGKRYKKLDKLIHQKYNLLLYFGNCHEIRDLIHEGACTIQDLILSNAITIESLKSYVISYSKYDGQPSFTQSHRDFSLEGRFTDNFGDGATPTSVPASVFCRSEDCKTIGRDLLMRFSEYITAFQEKKSIQEEKQESKLSLGDSNPTPCLTM